MGGGKRDIRKIYKLLASTCNDPFIPSGGGGATERGWCGGSVVLGIWHG